MLFAKKIEDSFYIIHQRKLNIKIIDLVAYGWREIFILSVAAKFLWTSNFIVHIIINDIENFCLFCVRCLFPVIEFNRVLT